MSQQARRKQNMADILIAGATGATGSILVEQLLGKNHNVRVIVRSPEKLSREILQHPNLTVTNAPVLDLSDNEMAALTKGCSAVVSCLGHVLSFSGMFGKPRKLCTDTTRRLCAAIAANQPDKPAKFILMSSVGVPHPGTDNKRTWQDRALLSLLHVALPPHNDNESAAAYLLEQIGRRNEFVEWCSVRPDSLIDAETSPYEITEAPSTGILSGLPTSRANVADFMTRLVEDQALWQEWKFRMPVVMNTDD